jgi:hypothetical protein
MSKTERGIALISCASAGVGLASGQRCGVIDTCISWRAKEWPRHPTDVPLGDTVSPELWSK